MDVVLMWITHPDVVRVGPWLMAIVAALLLVRSLVTNVMQRQEIRELREELGDMEAVVAYHKAQATIDPLTAALNRRGFDDFVDQVLAAGARRAPLEPTVMAIIDLDSFKLLNDTLGHHAGDEALVTLAKLLKLGVRKGDIIGRLGGDEFAVLFVGGDRDAVAKRLGAIRSEYEARMDELYARFGKDRPDTVSLTFGLASREHRDQRRSELLALADAELYLKKPQGTRSRRNEVH